MNDTQEHGQPRGGGEKEICVRYHAMLRETAGIDVEIIQTHARTAACLFRELQRKHGFRLPETHLRVAINNEFSPMDQVLAKGDEVVFVPPVAGG